MGIRGKFFVTPHAVHQFQRRVADLDFDEARDRIIQGLAAHAMRAQPTGNGTTYRIRVRSAPGYPYDFRALIGPPAEDGGDCHAVLTILRSGETTAAQRDRPRTMGRRGT